MTDTLIKDTVINDPVLCTCSTRIGIGVMILKDDQVLLGKRKGSHGTGEYSFPGGHLQYMEGFEECAHREVSEECGIEIENVRFQFLGNIVDYPPKHYIQIGFIADWKQGEPQVLEPDKCEAWAWYDFDKLPQPIFRPCLLALESYGTKQSYFDKG